MRIFTENGGISSEFEERAGNWIIVGLNIMAYGCAAFVITIGLYHFFRIH